MGDLSKDFSRSEFACKCGCGYDTVDAELLAAVQKVRDRFGERVKILSGCRCKAHNKAVGGEPQSLHLLGRAADIFVENVTTMSVKLYAEEVVGDKGGVGFYPDNKFVHIDSRGHKARWTR